MKGDVEKGTVGSAFEQFLKAQGDHEEDNEQAVKRALAFQRAEAMKAQGISKVEMVKRLTTSRSQLDSLLDPANVTVLLSVIFWATKLHGRGLRLELS